MGAARDRLSLFIAAARKRYLARMRSLAIVALLLAALLWLTKWPSLRLGLIVLLAGQAAVILLLLNRARRLGRDQNEASISWFDEEAAFVTRLALFENLTRTIGFLVLGYGIWVATRSWAIALGLGVGYPALAFFGMERRNQQRARKMLVTEKEAMLASLNSASF